MQIIKKMHFGLVARKLLENFFKMVPAGRNCYPGSFWKEG